MRGLQKRVRTKIECERTDLGTFEVRLTLVAQMRSGEESTAVSADTVTYEELMALGRLLREWQSSADTSQVGFRPHRKAVAGRRGFVVGKAKGA